MGNYETADRRALGILSDTVAERLGPSDKVTREIRRAYTSGKQIDRFMARAAFDALPGWQRADIGEAATRMAREIVQKVLREALVGTARDWRDLEKSGQAGKSAERRRDGDIIPAPPRFMLRPPRGA